MYVNILHHTTLSTIVLKSMESVEISFICEMLLGKFRFRVPSRRL